jgi:hypothetical protein
MAHPNSSLATAAFAAAESVASQPQLFDASIIPLDLELGRAAKHLAHTGAVVTSNDAKVLAIAACKLAGLSDKETAARVRCSRNTVGPVMEHLERSGRIPVLQERLTHHLGRVAESAALELDRVINDGVWNTDTSGAVRSLGVAMGIATERLLLMTGQATQIIEQRVGAPSADAVKQWEEKLRQAFGPVIDLTTDSQSVVSTPKCLTDKRDTLVATCLATQSSPAEALVQSGPGAPGAPGGLGAGGGSVADAGRQTSMCSSE